MSELQVRIPKATGQRLFQEVTRAGPVEAVVFGLVTHAVTQGRELILVRDIRIPPKEAYLSSSGHGARWSGRYTIDLLNEAVALQCGLFIFHFHYGPSVRMSRDDISSANQLLPKFQLVIPDRPHGSIVLGADSTAGLILMPRSDQTNSHFTLRLLRDRIVDWPLHDAPPRERLRFQRQPLVRGQVMEAIIKGATVVVTGQSGGGTHVCLHLAQHGIGKIHGIDDDYVDDGNRVSGIGFSERDVAEGTEKIAALRKLIRRLTSSVKYSGLKKRVPEQLTLNVLKQADVIVGCVNNLHARADLQEIALRYAIPYIDIGLVISTDDTPTEEFPGIRAISGNIFTYIPGQACMWCTGFLSKEKLDGETGGRGRPYLESKDGADAHVLSFNGVLASQAVTDVLNLLLGFSRDAEQPVYRKYDGLEGTMRICDVRRNETCEACATYLAAGDPTWAGSSQQTRRVPYHSRSPAKRAPLSR
jgi:hypothetical protein